CVLRSQSSVIPRPLGTFSGVTSAGLFLRITVLGEKGRTASVRSFDPQAVDIRRSSITGAATDIEDVGASSWSKVSPRSAELAWSCRESRRTDWRRGDRSG